MPKSNHMYYVVAALVLAMALSWEIVPAMADSAVKTLDTPAVAEQARQTEVSIQGDMFFINGRPTYEGRTWRGHKIEGLLMNARLVQGIFDDLNPQTISRWAYPDTGVWDAERNTSDFITAMPSWREHGLLSFTINLQGGSPEGYSREQPWHNSALRADGSLRDEYMNRLERILDRADELGMVPMLGIYYFGQDGRLADEAAVIRGVENAVNWVLEKGYRNVLIEINNECNVNYDHAILQPPRVHELIDLAKRITRDGRRLYVSTSYGGGTVPQENVVQLADFILLHGNGVSDPNRMAEMIRAVRAMDAYGGQPIINNEDDQPWRVEHQGWGDEGNNFAACVENYASWGYFDFRRSGEDFNEGYQSVPVNWQISSDRKRAFFDLTSRITGVGAVDTQRIKPYSKNSYYWQYKGEPVLLLGGTDQDNLFNHPDSLEPDGLESHLDLLVSVGGNYVRNTMSHRDAPNVFAFKRTDDGRFDLNQWNDEYWRRFDHFLRMTQERNIIVQIEVWETWDHYADHEPQGGWSKNPFNPENNINYTVDEAQLPTEIGFNPTSSPTSHTFFHTVPDLKNNQVVLPYQQALIDKILSYSLNYSHVLYCMNNETGEPPQWGEYWVKYIRAKAEETGKSIEITDMRRSENLSSPDHRLIQDNPQLYTFIEVSQNNGTSRSGQNHWDPLMEVRQYLASSPRPINNVKVYGGEGGWGGIDQGVQKFWRNLFAGCASVRFHRRFPAAGIGLSELAQANLRSARMLTGEIDVFASTPRNDLLSEREPNEAYCFAQEGKTYALYFPNGGAVKLDLSGVEGEFKMKWLNIFEHRWTEEKTLQGGKHTQVVAPDEGHWAAVIVQP